MRTIRFGLPVLVLCALLPAGAALADVVLQLRDGSHRVAGSLEFKDGQVLLPDGVRLGRERVREIMFLEGRNNWSYQPDKPDPESYRSYLETGRRLKAKYRQYANYHVEDENIFTVHKDGTTELWVRSIVYIGRDDGKAAASVRHGIMTGRERVHFLALRSISDDLSIQDVPAGGIRFEQTDARSRFYGRWLTVLAEIPGAQEDGLLEITKRVEVYNPIEPGIWKIHNFFQSVIPVARSVIVLRLPEEMPLNMYKSRLPEELGEPKQRKHKGYTEYRWETGEQPPVVGEPYSPPIQELVPFLAISPLFDHQRLYDLAKRLVGDKTQPDKSVREKARELVRGAKSDEEKVARIYHFLQRDIRYVSVKGSIGSGWGGHPAWMTLKNRYGDCIDKAILMTALLEALGIRSEVALVMTQPRAQMMEKLPVLEANHAITRVTLGDRSFYLDSTATDYRYPTLRSDDHGAVALLYKSGKLEKVPAPDPAQNRTTYQRDMRLEANGLLHLTRTVTATGQYEAGWRSRLTGITEKRLKEWLRKEAGKLVQGGRLISYKNEGVEDLSAPVRSSATWELPGYLQRTGDLRYFQMPFSTMKFKQASLPKRKHPLFHPRTESTVFNNQLELPPSFKLLALPGPLSLKTPHYQIEAAYTMEGRVLKFSFRFDHFATQVPPEDYPAYREGLLQTEKYLGQFLFLVTEEGGAS